MLNTLPYDAAKAGINTQRLNNTELEKKLDALAMNTDGNIDQLQARSREANIPITETVGVVKEGFMGKAKGAAQIVCERGFIGLDGGTLMGINILCTVYPQRKKSPV